MPITGPRGIVTVPKGVTIMGMIMMKVLTVLMITVLMITVLMIMRPTGSWADCSPTW